MSDADPSTGRPDAAMVWHLSHRADPHVVPIADRHYNRQKIGSPQFVPPGRCLVLKHGTPDQLRIPWTGGMYWITSWPFGEYVKHRWPGAWVCSAFRKEGPGKASDFIRQAIAATRYKWPGIPDLGMVTFIDAEKVTPIKRRGREVWGHSYEAAGFEPDGKTEGGLLAFRMKPDAMPEPCPCIGGERLPCLFAEIGGEGVVVA